jgi:hypothetical protein
MQQNLKPMVLGSQYCGQMSYDQSWMTVMLFFCFEEPMPAFPPSYKRRKYTDADCGDYTVFDTVIKGYSNTGYVENLLSESGRMKKASTSSKLMKGLNKHFKAGSSKRNTNNSSNLTAAALASTVQYDIDDSAYELDNSVGTTNNNTIETRSERSNSTVNMEDYDDDVIPEKEDPSKLRPPSYTDRVLVHSLPDRRERITVQSYDSCDLVRVSDHRPVAMTLLLEVNSNVFYQETSQDNQDRNYRPVRLEQQAHAKEPQFELYELQIAEFSVTLVDLLYVESDDEDEDASTSTPNVSANSNEMTINEENPFRASLQNAPAGVASTNSASSSSTSVAARVGGSETAAMNPLHHPRSTLARSMTNNNAQGMRTTKLSMFETVEGSEETTTDAGVAVGSFSNVDGSNEVSPLDSRPVSHELSPKRSARIASDESETNDSSSSSPMHSPPMSPDRSNLKNKKKKGGIKFVEGDSNTLAATATLEQRVPFASSSSQENNVVSKDTTIEMSTLSSVKSSASTSDKMEGEEIIEVLSPPSPPSSSSAPPNRAELMKKSRSRSIFGTLTRQGTSTRRKSIFQTIFGGGDDDESSNEQEIRKTESQEDIIKNMADQSMMWKGEASGDWRRRVLEEEKERLEREKYKGQKLMKKKKKKMNQHRIDQITLVFPLPSKDPLLSYRRMYDFAKAFDIDGHNSDSKHNEFDLENQMRDVTSDDAAREALLKASSVFSWHAADANRPASVTNSNSNKKEAKYVSADKYQVRGCVSSELGAHALVKVTTRTGTELGSSVVCVTHLLHRDPTLIRSSFMSKIPLSSGGQNRGFISGKFSLKYVPSTLSPPPLSHGHSHSQNHNQSHNHSKH